MEGEERDWAALRLEYATTDISYRALAEKYGVPVATLTGRAQREKWAADRKKHREKVVEKTIQKSAGTQARTRARKLVKIQKSADAMAAVIQHVFKDAEQFRRHIVTEGLGLGETRVACKTFDKVDTKAIKDLTGALKDLAAIMRDVYDMPGAVEQQGLELAEARLRLDERKAALGVADEGDTGVIMLPAADVPEACGGDED